MGKLKVTQLELEGVKIIEPQSFEDNRGCSLETYSIKDFEEIGIKNHFVLDYQSINSCKNTLRGIHFQNNPKSQAKLVRVLSGAIEDFVVDFRKNSPTYKSWVKCELSATNKKQIFIPSGFGHGFVTTEDDTVVLYKFDEYYDGDLAKAIKWNDEDLKIDWGVKNPILSKKDEIADKLIDSDVNL